MKVRIERDLLAALDAWIEAQDDHPSRPEAIRRILRDTLR
ncbi:ribbon-helix-helix protein, CopG family [Croceicoccus sp. BE223]|nr:ribbon-helix-helix protein, CopG family [Croceicoccus sp. BE223]MDR7101541.1 metal-responsive CopG/Arc/MetJ family transcriptional regulator [Croceicoccus sp. BE223]